MAQVTFYTLDAVTDERLAEFIAEMTCAYMRERQRILILCADQAQAEQIDEQLWQLPANAFIPHNLVGEGPPQGTPVLIAWTPLTTQTGHRTVLINLSQDVPEQAQKYRTVIETVPVADAAREAARARYRVYRQLGMTLQTLPASLNVEGHHG
ncbi:MAG: DNA polymerase III subunit chi [Idiomarina sp.]|nr:DNA polymerase III subunit chi [Idiomarina sp.]